ncbi:hypothetical protein D9756_010706 [Leucocoprinus leucothites]|uniref:Mid2 domain-containing protein n=1 Tax=Leucocoprinus leucothites TaxID=201217 RepID=A0A8H5FS41_9AGAR|nr:hypothetical protein D9756_010706 [Leucoagaricus leucothites]
MWVALCISLLALLEVIAGYAGNDGDDLIYLHNVTLSPNESITVRVHDKANTKWDLVLYPSDDDSSAKPQALIKEIQRDKPYYDLTSDTMIDTTQNPTDSWILVAQDSSDKDSRLGSSKSFQIMSPASSGPSTPSTPQIQGIPLIPSSTLPIPSSSLSIISSSPDEPTAGIGTTSQGGFDTGSGPSNSTNPTKSNKPLIIGLTVGISAFVLGCILVFLFIRRRRRRLANEVPHDVVFNRELMFERRPSPFDTWSLRSVELEKGSLRPGAISPSRVHITRTTTSDRDVS